jgi:transposase
VHQLIDVTTALAVVSETGSEMSRFPTVKHFTSRLGLCLGTRITGGKVLGGQTKRVVNRAAQALRLAAAALRTSKSALRGTLPPSRAAQPRPACRQDGHEGGAGRWGRLKNARRISYLEGVS